jgi:two-component system OmpR family response regulator
MRILIIEDEPQLARHVNAALVRHGHTSSIEGDGAAGLQAALTVPPDLIILDVNLPTLDGFEVLAGLRAAQSTARVLMLTSRGEVGDRVKGLKGGADDYIPKPFAMDELIARVEALGRRAGVPELSVILQVADLHVNVPLRRVLRAGQPIGLSPREFELLQVLMQEPGRYFARTELYDRVWQQECSYDSRTVEMFITRLRRKIDADFPIPLIHTLRNVGYTIQAPNGDRPSR